MNTRGKLSLVSLSVLALGACGGSSSGTGNLTFSELADKGNRLIEDNRTLSETPIVDMPTSGSTNYLGIAAYGGGTTREEIVANPTSLSQLSLNADFADSTVSGRLFDFEATNGSPISGSLRVTNGSVTGNDFIADISGDLTESGVVVNYDGSMAGAFLGPDASAVSGVGSAMASADGFVNQTVNGVFEGTTD